MYASLLSSADLLDDVVPDAHVSRVVHAGHPQPKHVRPVRWLLLLVVAPLDHLGESAATNRKNQMSQKHK